MNVFFLIIVYSRSWEVDVEDKCRDAVTFNPRNSLQLIEQEIKVHKYNTGNLWRNKEVM